MSLIQISICVSLAIFLIVIATNARMKVRDIRQERVLKTTYIWDDWSTTVYTTLFGDTQPEKILKAFGLEYDKYMMNCDIIGRIPDLQKEAAYRVVGVFSLVLGLILTLVFRNPIFVTVGIVAYFTLAAGIARKVAAEASDKKNQFQSDIVRFMDLLLSALQIGMPIDAALAVTADSVDCVLSNEIKLSLAETQIGAKGWQKALEDIARKYEVDAFSDLVMDIVSAYNKGVNITDAVSRKNVEIKQNQILMAKEKTAKMSTTVLVPITVFKLLPLIIIMMLPIVVQVMDVFG